MTREHMVNDRGGVVIFNPTAGRGRGGILRLQVQDLLGEAWEWRPTLRAGHARELAKQAADEGAAVVAAFGGDGTVGDVARGIFGSESTLGVLPVGTGNDYARNLGIPLDLPEAVRTILTGTVRYVDVGIMNGTPFINNAGLGFDAQVMVTMNRSIRFARGKPAFTLAVLKTAATFQPFTLTIQCDDEPPVTEKAIMVSMLNGQMYGAGMKAAPLAEMDDGMVDVVIVKAMPKPQLLLEVFPRLTAGTHAGHKAIIMKKARRVQIQTIPAQPLNMDGDVSGITPAVVEMRSRALKVLVR